VARFKLISPIAGIAPRSSYQKFPSGTVVVDSVGNAQPGDVVWPSLCLAPTVGVMAPLDSAAQALLPGGSAANPIWPGPPGFYSGGQFGCGLDAGS
jgi:hypothetical protein